MDAAVTPGGIFVSEANDGLSGLEGGGWPAWPMRVGPVVRHQTSMPSEDRVRLHPEHRPTVAAEHACEGGEDRSIGGSETRTRDLAFEDRELMAQHEKLGVLGPVRAPTEHQQVDDKSDETVEAGHVLSLIDARRPARLEARPQLTPPDEFSAPTGNERTTLSSSVAAQP